MSVYFEGVLIGGRVRRLSGTALQGDETIIFFDNNIKTTSLIDYSVIGATSGKVFGVSKVDVIAGKITLTFEKALSENVMVRLKIKN